LLGWKPKHDQPDQLIADRGFLVLRLCLACQPKENVMTLIKRIVVAALLAVWCFPAAGFAKTEPANPPAFSAPVGTTAAAPQRTESAEVANLAAREKQAQSQNLTDFNGGAVYVYLGSGAVLVLVIILIILLV
jgi:hypothetical protein